MLAPDPCPNMPTRFISRSPRVAKKPFLHWTVVVAMSGQRRYETHRGKAVLGQRILKNLILVGVCVRRIAIKVQDHRRILDSLGFYYIHVEVGISSSVGNMSETR